MAQQRHADAHRQQQEQNPMNLLDALYCEEEHLLDQDCDSSEEHQSNFTSNINNYNDDNNNYRNKSNPPQGLLTEQDLFWEEEELRFLLSKEERNPLYGSIEESPSTAAARREGLDWMVRVAAHYAFSPATAVLAANFLDRFLCSFLLPNERGKPWMTQLAAVACLSLAAKVEETQVPLLLDLQVEDARFVFEAKTIQRMEILVLSALQWKMNPVTPLSFLEFFARWLGLKDRLICREFLRRCERLLLSLVSDFRFMRFLPSVLAMATVVEVMDVALEPCIGVASQNQILGLRGIDKDEVGECCELIRKLAMAGGQCQSNKRKLWSPEPPPGSPSCVIDASFSCESSNDSWAAASSSVSSSPVRPWKRSRGEEDQNLPKIQCGSADFLSISR